MGRLFMNNYAPFTIGMILHIRLLHFLLLYEISRSIHFLRHHSHYCCVVFSKLHFCTCHFFHQFSICFLSCSWYFTNRFEVFPWHNLIHRYLLTLLCHKMMSQISLIFSNLGPRMLKDASVYIWDLIERISEVVYSSCNAWVSSLAESSECHLLLEKIFCHLLFFQRLKSGNKFLYGDLVSHLQKEPCCCTICKPWYKII